MSLAARGASEALVAARLSTPLPLLRSAAESCAAARASAVAAMSVPLLFSVAAMVAFYVGAAYREERQLLRSAAGDDYRAYRRQAGVLLPKSLLSRR